ncbi:MAG: hypothetical protein EOM64_01875 [Erysipelotrichia bacterium]|nr:hypothetical protein [Erysipelotrichia bacterium]
MHDTMNEIIKYSPFGGQLMLEEVKGVTSGAIAPENNVDTAIGTDRNMFSYIPKSGCPHAKQCQVLMVLRDSDTQESAESLMRILGLDVLAEENHFILLFPNPLHDGWNYQEDEHKDSDVQFLVRCFAALPKSKGKVAGFNGMIFQVGTSETSSAMAAVLAVRKPMDAAAIMIGDFPENFRLPEGKYAEQTAWVYETNLLAAEWLNSVNSPAEEVDGCFENCANRNVRYWLKNDGLNKSTMKDCWDRMFSETRRWRNDTNGTYQPRINFTEKGYFAHVEETLPGTDHSHTWYEYIPEALRGTDEKVPLVLYFHGINCNSLYGAEQSGWADIADRDGLIAVFPHPAIEERWNVWDDRRIPSDVDFVMALIDHMKTVHPIDESRIYISGFSMGSMFTNALAQSYPEKFAGAVACNGPDQGYLLTLDESVAGLKMFRPDTVTQNIIPNGMTESPTKVLADQKKATYNWHMPFVQFAGQLDGVGFRPKRLFPLQNLDDGMWIGTIQYWKQFNDIPVSENMFSAGSISGLKADFNSIEDERFLHQSWQNRDGEILYHFITAARMPHAVDLKEIELGWNLVKNFVRNSDGSLLRK